ncbi:cytochrome c family protein [Pelagibacteraceae bacterium]|nr:cytochrome c family protein [Pelagibacteraceae bacterium]
MDSLEINKIVACILVVALVVIGLSNLTEILYEVEKPEVAHYIIEGVDDEPATIDTAVSEEVEEIPIQILLASASVDKGAKVFKKCSNCHVPNEGGANKIGPALWNIVNKDIGGADFAYSNAMSSYGGKWSYEELNGFLKNPKKYMEGTKMSFAGLKKETDRANVILYLRSLSNNPAPIE